MIFVQKIRTQKAINLFILNQNKSIDLPLEYYYKSMNPRSQNSKKKIYSIFSIIIALLALGHFVTLQFSTKLAKEIDTYDSKFDNYIQDWNAKQNVPFISILGIFAAAQFCTAISIFIFARRSNQSKTLYYNSLFGLLVTFAVGVSLTILASEYNSGTRFIEKDNNPFPSIMSFYYSLQIDATATFLFSVPMLLYIFVNNLEGYLEQQKQSGTLMIQPSAALNNVIWLLGIFFINSVAQIAFIFNVDQFTAIEDKKYYNLEDLADQYTFYIAVGVVVSIVAYAIQFNHFKNPFLAKKRLVLIATLAAMFQFGSFILMAIKAVQFHLDISLMQKGICYFPDCNEASKFRWEITGYSALTLLILLLQIPYFRVISNLNDIDVKRDTLLTQGNISEEYK